MELFFIILIAALGGFVLGLYLPWFIAWPLAAVWGWFVPTIFRSLFD